MTGTEKFFPYLFCAFFIYPLRYERPGSLNGEKRYHLTARKKSPGRPAKPARSKLKQNKEMISPLTR